MNTYYHPSCKFTEFAFCFHCKQLIYGQSDGPYKYGLDYITWRHVDKNYKFGLYCKPENISQNHPKPYCKICGTFDSNSHSAQCLNTYDFESIVGDIAHEAVKLQEPANKILLNQLKNAEFVSQPAFLFNKNTLKLLTIEDIKEKNWIPENWSSAVVGRDIFRSGDELLEKVGSFYKVFIMPYSSQLELYQIRYAAVNKYGKRVWNYPL